jgi:hypothetical protein
VYTLRPQCARVPELLYNDDDSRMLTSLIIIKQAQTHSTTHQQQVWKKNVATKI